MVAERVLSGWVMVCEMKKMGSRRQDAELVRHGTSRVAIRVGALPTRPWLAAGLAPDPGANPGRVGPDQARVGPDPARVCPDPAANPGR